MLQKYSTVDILHLNRVYFASSYHNKNLATYHKKHNLQILFWISNKQIHITNSTHAEYMLYNIIKNTNGKHSINYFTIHLYN